MTKDGRGREVFSIHPAILGGGARYRTLAPAEADGQESEQDQAGQDPSSDGAARRGGKRAPRAR